MRKGHLKAIYFLPIIIWLLLSCCSVQKRHYQRGWYISESHKKHAVVKTEIISHSSLTNNSNLVKDNQLFIKNNREGEDKELLQVSNTSNRLFIGPIKIKALNDTLKRKKKKIFGIINLRYDPNEVKGTDEAKEKDHEFKFPLLPLLLFGLGIVLISISIFALTLILKDLFMIAMLYGAGFLIVSLFLSIEFKKRIIKYQLPHKLWPYNLVIGISATIAIILVLSAVILAGALLFL
ncbi:MAG: hypothetical protein JNJ41_04710 [Bacteroidia bacterium]|nr:hypothetical protein [Bacteroidia bacterium]